MGDKSPIEWTDASWNPLAAFDRETGKRGWFCTKVSEGCTHCYAEILNKRLGTGHLYRVGNLPLVEFRLVNLDQPIRWRRPRKIFVNSMTDLFHEAVPFNLIDQVFAAMALAPHHTFQVLTKRPERMAEYFTAEKEEMIARWADAACAPNGITASPCAAGVIEDAGFPLPNVWLGTSVEHQKAAAERIPHLLATPAAVRFLSCEPLLGPVDLRAPWRGPGCDWCYGRGENPATGDPCVACRPIHWVIAGGESGPGARPMHPDWVRSLRDQCQAAGVAYHFKQWGEYRAELRPGTEVVLADLSPGQRVAYGDGETNHVLYTRVGKHAAGRELDGRTWDEFPEVVRA